MKKEGELSTKERSAIEFIEGTGVSLNVTEDSKNNKAKVEISSAASSVFDFNYPEQVGTSPWEHWKLLRAAVNCVTPNAIVTYVQNEIWAFPFIAPRGGTIDYVGLNCTQGIPGSFTRVGFYEATSTTNLYPNNLVGETSPIDTGVAAVKKQSISLTFPSNNVLWCCILMDSDNIGFDYLASVYSQPIGGYNSNLLSGHLTMIYVGQAYGAFPTTFPAAANVAFGSSNFAAWVRYAA